MTHDRRPIGLSRLRQEFLDELDPIKAHEGVSQLIRSRVLTIAEGRFIATGEEVPEDKPYMHRCLPGGLRSIVHAIPPHEIRGDDFSFLLGDNEVLDQSELSLLFKIADRCKKWYWRYWYMERYKFITLAIGILVGVVVRGL